MCILLVNGVGQVETRLFYTSGHVFESQTKKKKEKTNGNGVEKKKVAVFLSSFKSSVW